MGNCASPFKSSFVAALSVYGMANQPSEPTPKIPIRIEFCENEGTTNSHKGVSPLYTSTMMHHQVISSSAVFNNNIDGTNVVGCSKKYK